MRRLIAIVMAVLFAAGLIHAPAGVAQTTKEKPKNETKAPAKTAADTKKEPIDINNASKATYDKIKDQIVAKQQAVGTGPASAATAPPVAAKTGESMPAAKTTATPEAKQPPAKGMVWVNTESKIFHREGDRWYGKTKHGKYMTEADAIKEGYREAKN